MRKIWIYKNDLTSFQSFPEPDNKEDFHEFSTEFGDGHFFGKVFDLDIWNWVDIPQEDSGDEGKAQAE